MPSLESSREATLRSMLPETARILRDRSLRNSCELGSLPSSNSGKLEVDLGLMGYTPLKMNQNEIDQINTEYTERIAKVSELGPKVVKKDQNF